MPARASAVLRHLERGSAVADFVLVSMLVALVFVGLLQLGFVLHARNTLMASAGEGARMGARADATPADGVARARELIAAQLPDRYADAVTGTTETVAGALVVRIDVQAPLPIIGPFGPSGGIDVTARAFSEQQ